MNFEKIRKDTLGCENVIHFNNAGSSLPPQCVTDTVVNYLIKESQVGGYEYFESELTRLEFVYDQVSQLINANREEIALMESATRAWTSLFYSLKWKKGQVVLTGQSDYASNFISYLQLQKEKEIVLEVLPQSEDGEICLQSLEKRLQQGDVTLVSLSHMPTNGGLIQPVEKVGALTQKYKVLFLLDACQSVGQCPIDVQKVQCDFLTGSGRKYLRGPRGTGFLFVKREHFSWLSPFSLDLYSASLTSKTSYEIRKDARMFESWESGPALRLGLGKACEYANNLGVEETFGKIQILGYYLWQELKKVEGLEVHDIVKEKGGIVSFSLIGKDPKEV
ncbi:MAG: aminotransferase class V-fold PLP-dependent enzyme, partial [Bdellovibrionota bacterium]|nr:aminotransferase class V-fold PLP-dependent enzyme [Bdellovibrionota bacterium]